VPGESPGRFHDVRVHIRGNYARLGGTWCHVTSRSCWPVKIKRLSLRARTGGTGPLDPGGGGDPSADRARHGQSDLAAALWQGSFAPPATSGFLASVRHILRCWTIWRLSCQIRLVYQADAPAILLSGDLSAVLPRTGGALCRQIRITSVRADEPQRLEAEEIRDNFLAVTGNWI